MPDYMSLFGALQCHCLKCYSVTVSSATMSLFRRYCQLGVVLTVNLIKNISNLLLGQPLCVQHSCQSVTLLFLIAQYGKNLRMKVAITVSRYPELKFSAVAVCVANTISIPFITLRIR